MDAFVPSADRNAMFACGTNDVDLSGDMTPVERVDTDLVEGNLESCKDKTFKEVDYYFNTYSDLIQHQGHIRILNRT